MHPPRPGTRLGLLEARRPAEEGPTELGARPRRRGCSWAGARSVGRTQKLEGGLTGQCSWAKANLVGVKGRCIFLLGTLGGELHLLGDTELQGRGAIKDAVTHTLPLRLSRLATPACPSHLPKIRTAPVYQAVLGSRISSASSCQKGVTLFPDD